MRKKSKNWVLVVILLVSVILLLLLLLVLDRKEPLNTGNNEVNNKENQQDSQKEEYYLPSVTTKKVTVSYGTEVTPEQFIQSVESIYEVSYNFEKEPNLKQYGLQEVIVLVTDVAGNSAAVKAQLNILNVKEVVKVNLGDSLPVAEDFLMESGSDIFFVTDISKIDTTIAKEYNVYFVVDGAYTSTTMSVGDYAAPEVTTRQVEEWLNHPVSAERFIEVVSDATTVEYEYATEPDWTLAGEQQVSILASDENGNATLCYATLLLHADTKAPVVSVSNLDTIAGSVISYRSAVSYYDNASPTEEITVEIDNSNVNLDVVGEYEVTYTVTDFAGNSTSVVGKVNVVEEEPMWNDEALLQEKAETVLAELLSEEMSDYEKARAIHTWVNQNIRFINFSEKDNFARGAYEGLFLKEGDCFVYAATSKYLLTLASLQNIDIKKSSTDPSHYWNLVYIEDGWYHFDACPTKEGVTIFLYTDAELEAFSNSRGNSHVYDKSLYPEIK